MRLDKGQDTKKLLRSCPALKNSKTRKNWTSKKAQNFSQGKTPRVDPACADCPGFLVLGDAPAPASTFASEPQIVPLA